MERYNTTKATGLLFTACEDQGNHVRRRYVYCEIAHVDGTSAIFPTWLPGMNGAKVHCRRLEVGAVQSSSGSQTAVVTGVSYYTLDDEEPAELRKREATIAYLNDRLQKIERNRRGVMTFGNYVAMFAEAVGLSTIIFRTPDGGSKVFSVKDGAARIDRLLGLWKAKYRAQQGQGCGQKREGSLPGDQP
jgi:hypothetical protein